MSKWERQYNEVGFYEFHGWSRPTPAKKTKELSKNERRLIINILLMGYIIHAISYQIIFAENKPALIITASIIALAGYIAVKNNRIIKKTEKR